MMRKMVKLIRTVTTAVVVSILLLACSSDQLPIGSSLGITPDGRSIRVIEFRDENGVCIFFENNYVDIPVVITLVDSQQSPIGNADVSVYLDFAENTFTGVPVLGLFRDLNSNGVIDDDSEFVSGIDDPIAVVRTDEISGESVLLLRINLSCAFRGEMFAFVDGVTASSVISVESISDTTMTGG